MRLWSQSLVIAGVVAVGGGAEANAAQLPSNCAQSGSQVKCTYAYTGAEQTFTVPAGVTSVTADAVGAPGGPGYEYPGAGGAGGTASGVLTVTDGEALYVEVGGDGVGGRLASPGGWNGGGNGGPAYYGNGAGGGGASDVRTVSASAAGSLSSRLLVAGGGGGGGGSSFSSGGAGGAGDSAGSSSSGSCGGGGGGSGILTGGGLGGSSGNCTGTSGTTGALGLGGPGAGGALSGNAGGGGGGGGGFYGGGGGGSGDEGGGGGGGASYAPGGTTGVDTTGTPVVTITYTIVGAPANTSAPAIAGTADAGRTLTCSPGSWSGRPQSYSYQWSLDGTPIVGATASQYTVVTIDEGGTLTCTVTASNGAGPGTAVTSGAVTVPVPHVRGCPPVAGTLSGTRVGRVFLGMTRAQARHAYTRSSTRGSAYRDFFCLTPRGVRVGYASPRELGLLAAGRRHSYEGRVIWISTASPHFAIDGIRPGATVAAASTKLKLSKVFVVGKNDWYLAPAGSATAVLKVRHGVVEEIGLGERSLTSGGRAAQRVFLTSFE